MCTESTYNPYSVVSGENMCEIIADLCGFNGACVDLPMGSYRCDCNEGFRDVGGFCESKYTSPISKAVDIRENCYHPVLRLRYFYSIDLHTNNRQVGKN